MASGRRGQNDVTLGAGHVAGIFLGVVLLCGIFFALGYVMGRGRGAPRQAASSRGGAGVVDASGNLTGTAGAPAPTDWDFYPHKSGSASGTNENPVPGLAPASAPKPPAPRPVVPLSPSGPTAIAPEPASLKVVSKPPVLAGGRHGITLQVAAFNNRRDALALAGFLKQSGYPAFVWGPASDKYYRVEVGPYPDAKRAAAVGAKLETAGFKSIVRR